MKKVAIGLCAIIVALTTFAFTREDHSARPTDPYWFQTDASGNVINATSVPPQQAADPFGCAGGTRGCSKSYTSYMVISPGVYGPSGSLQDTHKKQ